MTELPPDPPRLRAILAHLDQQLAESETVGIYLRLQRDEVLQRLQLAERGQAPRPAAPPPPSRPAIAAPTQQTGYAISRRPTKDGPQPSFVHTVDCRQKGGLARPVPADAARRAIADGLAPCPFCRPDSALGILD